MSRFVVVEDSGNLFDDFVFTSELLTAKFLKKEVSKADDVRSSFFDDFSFVLRKAKVEKHEVESLFERMKKSDSEVFLQIKIPEVAFPKGTDVIRTAKLNKELLDRLVDLNCRSLAIETSDEVKDMMFKEMRRFFSIDEPSVLLSLIPIFLVNGVSSGMLPNSVKDYEEFIEFVKLLHDFLLDRKSVTTRFKLMNALLRMDDVQVSTKIFNGLYFLIGNKFLKKDESEATYVDKKLAGCNMVSTGALLRANMSLARAQNLFLQNKVYAVNKFVNFLVLE